MTFEEHPHRLALIAAAGFLLLLLAPAAADSCDCMQSKPLSRSVRTESPFIFEGTVVELVERSLHTTRTTSSGGSNGVESLDREVVFEVRRAWNGVTTKRIAVSSELSNCMFQFEIDRTYIVFAGTNAKGRLATSICTRTTELTNAADLLTHLGQATAPK